MKDNKRDDILLVKEELDKISVSSEIIEHLNELINEKLDTINEARTTKKPDLMALYDILRLNNNYITLNHLITNELEKVNKNVNSAYEILNRLQGQDDNNEGGVSDDKE